MNEQSSNEINYKLNQEVTNHSFVEASKQLKQNAKTIAYSDYLFISFCISLKQWMQKTEIHSKAQQLT